MQGTSREDERDDEARLSTAPPVAHAASGVMPATDRDGGSEDESEQPTHVPSFDLNAMAEAAFHCKERPIPFDMAVPVRTPNADVGELGLRAAFLLFHVDGRATIAEIATMTAISTDEAQKQMRELVALGAIRIDGIARVEIPTPAESIIPPTLDARKLDAKD